MSVPLPLLSARRDAPHPTAAPQALQPIAGRRRRVEALYLHVPFCFHKCHYCDFYSIVEEPGRDRQEAFADRLIGELGLRAEQLDLRPRTLFVGGGTPTLLRPALWRKLLDALRRAEALAGLEEFTVEANPETVTDELMGVLRAGGVNRVSMGAQSFQPRLLAALERWHDPASVGRAVSTVRRAGIDNLNLDLIFAIPGQTLEELDADLDAALALGPEHLSCYGLTYEPQTAMTQKLRLGRITPAPEELERAMYARVMERLDDAGYEHYEVSAWARRGPAGRRGRHNLVYWTNGNWLGLGPAAASHLDGDRWKNQPHLGKYLATAGEPPTLDHERLPPAERLGEELMLRLRLREGVAVDWLRERLGADDPRWAKVDDLAAIGMVERDAQRLRLSRDGLFVADSVIGQLL